MTLSLSLKETTQLGTNSKMYREGMTSWLENKTLTNYTWPRTQPVTKSIGCTKHNDKAKPRREGFLSEANENYLPWIHD